MAQLVHPHGLCEFCNCGKLTRSLKGYMISQRIGTCHWREHKTTAMDWGGKVEITTVKL